MSGSLNTPALRSVTAPTRVAGVEGSGNTLAQPNRRPDPRAPEVTEAVAPRRPGGGRMSDGTSELMRALAGITPIIDSYFKGVREDDKNEADAQATVMALRQDVTTWADAVRQRPDLADRSPYFQGIYEDRLARGSVQRLANTRAALGRPSDGPQATQSPLVARPTQMACLQLCPGGNRLAVA